MNAGKRYAHIAVLIVAVLLAAFFLCACSQSAKRTPERNALLGDVSTDASYLETDTGEGDKIGDEGQPSADAPTDSTQGDAQSSEPTVSGDSSEGADVQSGQPQGDSTLIGGADQTTDNAQQGTSNNGENTDNSAQNNQSGEQTAGQDLADFLYDLDRLLNERAPFSRFKAPGEWTIYVGLTEVGRGTFTTDGVFQTTAFTQTDIKLWGTPLGNPIRLFLEFDAFTELKEVELREESLLMQIDLTQAELALLLPTPPQTQPDEGGETPPEQPQSPDDQCGEQGEEQGGESNEPTQQGEQGGEQGQSPEHNQNNDPPDQGQEQSTPEQGSEQGEPQQGQQQNGEQSQQGQEQGQEQGGEQNQQGGGQGQESSSALYCAECNAVLSQKSEHLSTCSLAGSVPEQSAAASFLSALPGMRESLSVTCLDASFESYSFVLNYLTQEGLATVKQALRGCQNVYEGANEMEADAVFGGVGVHFIAEIQTNGDIYRVKLTVTGYLLED